MESKDLEDAQKNNIIKHEVIEIADMVEGIQEVVKKQDQKIDMIMKRLEAMSFNNDI